MANLRRRSLVIGIWLLVGAILLVSFGLAGLWRAQANPIAAPISGAQITQVTSNDVVRAASLANQISDTEAAINSLNTALSTMASNANTDAATLTRLQSDLAQAQAALTALQQRLAATPTSAPPLLVPGDDGGGND